LEDKIGVVGVLWKKGRGVWVKEWKEAGDRDAV